VTNDFLPVYRLYCGYVGEEPLDDPILVFETEGIFSCFPIYLADPVTGDSCLFWIISERDFQGTMYFSRGTWFTGFDTMLLYDDIKCHEMGLIIKSMFSDPGIILHFMEQASPPSF
jgi:hypothetical protein